MHINIGGGNAAEVRPDERDFTDYGEISYLTFAWMVDQCAGLLDFDSEYLKRFVDDHAAKVKELKTNMANNQIHTGGYAQGMINDSFETAMAAAGSRTRAPGLYDTQNQIMDKYAPTGKSTNEFIHPSARIRITKRYQKVPKQVWGRATDQIAMANFRMTYDPSSVGADKKASGLVWVREDPTTKTVAYSVPEWQIQGIGKALDADHQYLEWRLLQGDAVKEERQMVENPSEYLKDSLPAAPVETMIAKVSSSGYKFLLGFLPDRFHFWENEQKTTLLRSVSTKSKTKK